MKVFQDSFLQKFGLRNTSVPRKPRQRQSSQPKTPQKIQSGRVPKRRSPGFDGATSSRLFYDWDWTILTFDELIRRALRKMRSRARDLEINNDYVKRFISHMVYNVIGHQGIHFQPRCKNANDTLDDKTNKILKEAFNEWSKAKNCTVTKNMSWHSAQAMIVRTLVRDGECLIRIVNGYKNDFSFAIQLIIPDSLDEQYTQLQAANSKNRIICGVELDDYRCPVNYYLRKNYKFQNFYYPEFSGIAAHEIVPADEIIHLYMPYRIDQTRGVPWIHAAMTRLKMIGAYEEAAVINARIGASKMGFFTREGGEDPEAAGLAQGDAAGNLSMSAEPGTFQDLPPGYKFENFDPDYPHGEFPNFMKAMLRGTAAGLDVSYTGLTNDLENVNYSSMRGGVLEEREVFKYVQKMVFEKVHQPIYEQWLKMAMLTGNLKGLLPSKYDDYVKGARWHGRRWDWVDPQKEIAGISQELELGLTSKTRVMAERKGYEFEEVANELKAEIELAEQLELPSANTPWAANPNPNATTKPLDPIEPDPSEEDPEGNLVNKPNPTPTEPPPRKPKQKKA